MPPIVAALEPLAAAVRAELHAAIRRSGLQIIFRPGLPLAMVVSAFRWETPVATASDVHMSSWSVAPLAVARTPPWSAVLGCWTVKANLDGWPRGPDGAELPRFGDAGLRTAYDLRACQNPVIA